MSFVCFAVKDLVGVFCLVGTLGSAQAAAAVPDLRGMAFEETLDGPAIVAPAIPEGGLKEPLPIVVHLTVNLAAFDGPGAAAVQDRLAARLALYKARKIPVVIVLGALPTAETEMQAWQGRLRAVAERHRGAIAGYEFGELRAGSPAPIVAPFAFAAKQASILIRSIDPDGAVALGPVSVIHRDWLTSAYGEGLAPYLDALSVVRDSNIFEAATEFGTILDRVDPTAALWFSYQSGANPAANMGTLMEALGTRAVLTVFKSSAAAVRDTMTAASKVADILNGAVVLLDNTGLHWFQAGVPASSVSARLVFNVATSATFLIYQNGREETPLELETDTSMTTPAIRNPYTGTVTSITAPARERNRPVRLSLPVASPSPLILDFNYGQAPYAVNLETRKASLPPVEEIVARHQQRQAAQDAALKNYIAHLRIEMHFHLSPAEPAYNVIMENTLFAEGAASEWVQHSFSLNGATWTSNPPPFPLLQPEKVMSLPLDLRLNQDYRYHLDGVDTVNEREAYAVSFSPVATTQTLYRGTVWIDRATFVRLKVSAVQLGGSGVVQGNEEEQIYGSAGELSNQPVWLMTHLKSKQTLLVAGRTILNEREVRLTDVRMNVPDFAAARASARSGDELMYRDTAQGVRFLVKRGEDRVVSEKQTQSVRAFALGADIDPSYDYPLPVAGLDLIDFNFLNKDLQLALLFGGVIGFGNIQKAGMLGGKVDASLDFFGIAVKGNDSVFDEQGEREGERVATLPSSFGFNVGYRVSSAHKVSARVDFRYDHYSTATLTSPLFVMPASTPTIGGGVGYEFRRRGYSVLANAGAFRRKTWTPWGDTAEFDPSTQTYTKYDVGLSKDFIFNTFHTIHLNGQYFSGQRLDRFSMYQFGMFDPARMHGVPASVRFAELSMLRASYSFNLFEQYRLDLFLDHAIGRRSQEESWQHVTGTGFALSLRGPKNTIIRSDVGRSILPDVYRGLRSTVIQILILKPL